MIDDGEGVREAIYLDELTGIHAINAEAPGKPIPRKGRILPPNIEPCPFCVQAKQLPNSTLTDSYGPRPLLKQGVFSYVIPNRWAPFSIIEGDSILVISNEHYTSFEEMPLERAVDFNKTLEYSYHNLTAQPNRLAFVNVGIGVGSSIQHLHGQVVASTAEVSEIYRNLNTPQLVGEDVMRNISSIINPSEVELGGSELPSKAVAYIPKSNSTGLDIRLFGGELEDRTYLTLKIIKALNIILGPSNYNLIHFFGSHVTEILIRTDYGNIYPRYFDLNLNVVDSVALAEEISRTMENGI